MEAALAEHSAANYYERREQQERGLAEATPNPEARNIHAIMAQTYARLAVEGESAMASEPRLHISEE